MIEEIKAKIVKEVNGIKRRSKNLTMSARKERLCEIAGMLYDSNLDEAIVRRLIRETISPLQIENTLEKPGKPCRRESELPTNKRKWLTSDEVSLFNLTGLTTAKETCTMKTTSYNNY